MNRRSLLRSFLAAPTLALLPFATGATNWPTLHRPTVLWFDCRTERIELTVRPTTSDDGSVTWVAEKGVAI